MNILDTQDDFALCNSVFGGLSRNPIDVETCGEMERVVRLVWDSSGLIGNGGFHYLFEGDYPGDAGFVYTAAAYARIGARKFYAADKEVVGCLASFIREHHNEFQALLNHKAAEQAQSPK